jgi:hypothetical protein
MIIHSVYIATTGDIGFQIGAHTGGGNAVTLNSSVARCGGYFAQAIHLTPETARKIAAALMECADAAQRINPPAPVMEAAE